MEKVEDFDILYCFDDNYNVQAITSIISYLDKVEKRQNINIIHTSGSIKDQLPDTIKNHKNLQSIKIYEFKDYEYQFPNIENVHISEATYFRLFIQNYLESTIKKIVYIDPDVVCAGNPSNIIESTFDEMKKTNKIISAKTEANSFSKNSDSLKRLNLSEKYFNAGVMLIDYEKWQEIDLTLKLIEELNKIRDKIIFWDQDVLNSFFNGDYYELDKNLNYTAFDIQDLDEQILLIHFLGSKKPWLTSGVFESISEIYHLNYRKFNSSAYHIEHKWKLGSIKELTKAIINFKIKNLSFVSKYLKEFFLSLRV